MINTCLMKLVWEPTERRGEKQSSGRRFNCFLVLTLSLLMTELQPQGKKGTKTYNNCGQKTSESH